MNKQINNGQRIALRANWRAHSNARGCLRHTFSHGLRCSFKGGRICLKALKEMKVGHLKVTILRLPK